MNSSNQASNLPLPKLLVIDDETEFRVSVCDYLQNNDYRVVQANNGEEAIELFKKEKPNLVLCDLRMPSIDGLNVIEKLSLFSDMTPIIALSGENDMDDVMKALLLGAADYFIKPIKDFELLEYSIKRGLREAKLQEENQRKSMQLELGNAKLRQSLDLLRVDQQAGRVVQTSLLPQSPFSSINYNCQHKIIPSLYLSGDFTDYWQTDDNELVFYIADVSGHGASSAFVTVLLKYLARQLSLKKEGDSESSPAVLLSQLNNELVKSDLPKHVTLFLGVLSADRQQLTYSVAGHYPMPVLRLKGKYQYLTGRDFPLGIRTGTEFSDIKIALDQDFSLNLFSDGVLDLLPKGNMTAKETFLLALVERCEGDFNAIANVLCLDSVKDEIGRAHV